MNLSSIVIQTTTEFLNEVVETVKAAEYCEYHLHDKNGKIIVTVEGKDTNEEIMKMRLIERIPHVISAEMVFAYSEDELQAEREKLEQAEDNIPEWLNDPNATASDIRYGGDLKKRF